MHYPTLNETARHLIAMADRPGWREHASLRLEELKASHEMYSVLPELIQQERARMREERAA